MKPIRTTTCKSCGGVLNIKDTSPNSMIVWCDNRACRKFGTGPDDGLTLNYELTPIKEPEPTRH